MTDRTSKHRSTSPYVHLSSYSVTFPSLGDQRARPRERHTAYCSWVRVLEPSLRVTCLERAAVALCKFYSGPLDAVQSPYRELSRQGSDELVSVEDRIPSMIRQSFFWASMFSLSVWYMDRDLLRFSLMHTYMESLIKNRGGVAWSFRTLRFGSADWCLTAQRLYHFTPISPGPGKNCS